MPLHGRPDARVYPVHLVEIDQPETSKPRLIDALQGAFFNGARVDVWSDKRQAWIPGKIAHEHDYSATASTVRIRLD